MIAVDTCGPPRTFRGGPVSPGRVSTIGYNICGEGAQLIVVSMEGGRTIRSLQSYVESGYSGTAAVSDTTIVMSAPWLQQSVGGIEISRRK
jgi:hypothetical protein